MVAVLSSSPKAHALEVLADRFEMFEHAPGSKTIRITEHMSMSDEADAIAFVRSLVAEALPAGAAITEVTAAPD